jgi:hypothetical protein
MDGVAGKVVASVEWYKALGYWIEELVQMGKPLGRYKTTSRP